MSERAKKVFESRGLDGQEEHVARIKAAAEALWDELDNISVYPGNSEGMRLISLAKTSLEQTVMWGVKSLSRNH